MLVVAAGVRSVSEALGLSLSVLRKSEAERVSVLSASFVQGPAVVLGAKQRAGRVVDLRACADAGVTVLRRATTGTAAWMGGSGLVFALALPHVAQLVPDATARSLLNRNVRPFLKGFTKAGALAHYFGREWISFQKRPAALLGFEVTRSGGVLIEVFVGFDEPVALPAFVAAAEERAVDRWQGKSVASVRDVCPDAQIETFAPKVMEGFVDRSGESAVEFDPTNSFELLQQIKDVRDPVPEGLVLQPMERVPIGYVEAAVSPDEPARKWLGGDVLAPTWVYEDVAAGEEIGAVAIDGATVDDLVKSLTVK